MRKALCVFCGDWWETPDDGVRNHAGNCPRIACRLEMTGSYGPGRRGLAPSPTALEKFQVVREAILQGEWA